MFLISDVLSVLPSWSKPTVAEAPTPGSPAPKDPKNRLTFPLTPARPLILLFARHVGCPFAERDVHALVHLVLTNPDRFQTSAEDDSVKSSTDDASRVPLQFLVVTHSPVDDSRAWFASVLHAAWASYTPPEGTSKPSSEILGSHFALFPDPSFTLPHAYGIGSLSTVGSVFSSSTFSSVSSLKGKGIANRTTGWGSDRWAGHGVCSIDARGIVRFFWSGQKADDEADWEAVVKALEV